MKMLKNIVAIIAMISAEQAFAKNESVSAHSLFSQIISSPIRSADLRPFPKWTNVMEKIIRQKNIFHGDCDKQNTVDCSIDNWQELLGGVKSKSFEAQLEIINDFANSHPYILDRINWGMEDYWETPYEFLDVSGDCEDYAITKYYSLRQLGISSERLRIMIVQDMNLGGIVHAILGVSDGDKLYILDNQIKRVVSADSIYHYKPIYSINETGWWLYKQAS